MPAVAPALTSPSAELWPAAPGSAAGPGRCAASGTRRPPRSAKQRAAPQDAPPGPGLPRGAGTPTHLGRAAIGHHVHLGDKLWKVKCGWKDRGRGWRFGEPEQSPQAVDPWRCLAPTEGNPTATRDFVHKSSCDVGGLVQLSKIFWKCGRRHKLHQHTAGPNRPETS